MVVVSWPQGSVVAMVPSEGSMVAVLWPLGGLVMAPLAFGGLVLSMAVVMSTPGMAVVHGSGVALRRALERLAPGVRVRERFALYFALQRRALQRHALQHYALQWRALPVSGPYSARGCCTPP